MKVYFSATITDDEQYKSSYKKILNILKQGKHDIYEYGSDQLDTSKILSQSDDEILKIYRELDKFLKQADVYIADISLPSVAIGYEISQAIVLRKPVLALINEKSSFQPLATIKGNKSRYLELEKYNVDTLPKILKDFMKKSKKKRDSKFILIVSPEIDSYLTWSSQENRMHKAQIVRDAIEKVMSKDTEYKKFLETA